MVCRLNSSSTTLLAEESGRYTHGLSTEQFKRDTAEEGRDAVSTLKIRGRLFRQT